MKFVNLGILAHVDAGKTSLTERLLFESGVIDDVGSVDQGNTQTDTLALEQQRGITIRSAVVSFAVGDVTVNLIDTPGHPDFIAEVERVLSVLDGAVLVVSAVEGVQAQTKVLMSALQRLHIPTLIFVNKIDRMGAAPTPVLRDISEKLSPAVIAMGAVRTPGSRRAAFESSDCSDPDFAARLLDLTTRHDESLLTAWVDDDRTVTYDRLRAELVAQTRDALAHPVFFGSAVTGAGVGALAAAVVVLLPSTHGSADRPVSGSVFKVERGTAGEKIAYLRLFSGALRVRDRLQLASGEEAKVTALEVSGDASAQQVAVAGQIAKVWGLASVQVGDLIGTGARARAHERQFSPPYLESVVDPRHQRDRGALHTALTQLADQDPLINVRQDDVRREISVSLYGEVQKEVIQATLAMDYGIDVTFRETTTVHVERLVDSGAAVEHIGKEPNPFLATVGLRVEPAPVGSGGGFRIGVELGSMPPAFFTAVEESVEATLRQGLRGWQVTDCIVTMTHSGYWARQSHSHGTFDASMSSTAGDFRNLTPLVLMAALQEAGTQVLEPIHGFRLEVPTDALRATLRALARVGGVADSTELRTSAYLVCGEVPAAQVDVLRQMLPTLSHGEGVLVSTFARYRPVRGAVPARARTDHNPINRREYLLAVGR